VTKRLSRHRVFIGLNETAGYYERLRAGFLELGIDCHLLTEQQHPFGYRGGSRYAAVAARFADARAALGAARVPTPRWFRAFLRALIFGSLHVAIRLVVMTWVLFRFDIVIFAGGISFFRGLDLPIYRAFGRRVICVFNGSDHRPPYLNRKYVRLAEHRGIPWLVRETERIKTNVRRVERSSTAVVALAASAQFHERPFVEFLEIGIPIVVEDSSRRPEPVRLVGPVRALHSPSDPEAKGTARIREIVHRLKDRGLEIELVEIIGRPHKDVLEAIEACDFIIDEVYSDTPMGGLATEAASFGKPTVGSGYFAVNVASDLRLEVVPPSLFCLPDELESAIERIAADSAFREELGARAQTFVAERWTPKAIATRFLALAEQEPPHKWRRDPRDLTYVLGWGMPLDMVRKTVKAILQTSGLSALKLHDKPRVEARVVSMIVE
jgi:glycosyltransferase involved in cell wall biosynthesis